MLSCGWSQPWIETLRLLQKNADVEVEIALVWEKDRRNFELAFPNAELFTIEGLWLFQPIDGNEPRDFKIDKKHLIVAETMLRRQNSFFYQHNYSESTFLFLKYVDFWMKKLKNVDLVISPSVPHRFFDYALYAAAEISSVAFLTFQQLPFGSRVVPLQQIYEMPKISSSHGDSCLPNDVETSIAKISGTYENAVPEYMVQQARDASPRSKIEGILKKISLGKLINRVISRSYPNTYQIMKTPLAGRVGQTWLKYGIVQINNRYKTFRLRRAYASKTTEVNLNRDYVLFALHYQPEETSCPSAFEYADQLLAIRILRSKIDKNIAIYVKEHKTQLYYEYEGDRGRNQEFYNYVMSIGENIHLVDHNYDPFKLIENSFAVATLTGTVGWEALIKGKPVIIFGRAWYETHTNVLRLTEQTEISEIKQHLNTKRFCDNETRIWLNAVLNSSISAIHYKGWRDRTDVSMRQSAANLSDYIYEHYLKK